MSDIVLGAHVVASGSWEGDPIVWILFAIFVGAGLIVG